MSLKTHKTKALGTEFVIKVPKEFSFVFTLCDKELVRIENTYSRFLSNSELSLLNSNVHSWQDISAEMRRIVSTSLDISEDTYGFFDITIKSELERIGYDAKYSFVEKKKKFSLKEFLYSFFNPIILKGNKIKLHKQIDLGGIGKGFAIDQLGKILKDCPSFYINGGGDILVKGKWDVELEHPDDKKRLIGKVQLENESLCASSSNHRKWQKHHHLLNPKKKKSANDMKGLFVRHKSAMIADAYATGLFASGLDTAKTIAKEQGLDVMLISKKMYISNGFTAELYK